MDLWTNAAVAAGKIVKVADTGNIAQVTPGTDKSINAVEKINGA